VERDQRAELSLVQSGWRVLTIWECELKQPNTALAALAAKLEALP
jgi:G:T-mismatch repair DNA endonuclease (very short patch repair protein)